MTDKELIKKWLKVKLAELYEESQCEVPKISQEIIKGKMIAIKESLSFIDSMQEEHKKCMYSKDNYTDEDRNVLCDGCEEGCEYNKKEPSIPDIVDEHFEEMLEDTIEKQFKVGDVVIYAASHIAYAGLYLLGNPNDLSIGYNSANEPYNIALKNCTVASEEEHKQFMRELESNGYKWNESSLRIEKKEEPVSDDFEKIVEEIAEPTILNAYGTKELARRLRATMCGTSVSEDLGEYINELSKQFPEVSFAKLSRIAVRVAKWQKQQTINKATKWLEEVLEKETSVIVCGSANIDFRHAIEKFKKAMED